jgi:Xaa-Pro aminopeptidase
MHNRIAKLRDLLVARDLDAVLISSPVNRRYLSGFRGSAGYLLISADAALLFSDFRYREQAARESAGFVFRENDNQENSVQKLVAEAIQELALQRVAIEAEDLSIAVYQRFSDALAERVPAAAFAPVEQLVLSLREVKDADELATLRRAIAITDAAISAVLPQLRPDMREREAAWLLEKTMREAGADGISFPIIVAAGPNAALPHHRAGDDLLGEGRPIVIDMGALLDGYHADLTRTVLLGTPDAQFRRIYNIVLEAQRRAISGVRAGVPTADVDALARDYIDDMAYGDQFGHGTGHGVGLDIHEAPGLRRAVAGKETPLLPAGAVTSIEPGIYIEGWGGVRIEDLVLVREHACEVLSQAAKLQLPD